MSLEVATGMTHIRQGVAKKGHDASEDVKLIVIRSTKVGEACRKQLKCLEEYLQESSCGAMYEANDDVGEP